MARSDAEVVTTNGSRYLQQLCKHWSHKFPVEYDAEQGRIDLGGGRLCLLQASAPRLVVRAEALGAEALLGLQQVIAEHLKRFAFREDLAFDWRRRAG